MNSENNTNYPSTMSKFMQESGLIQEEEQHALENYLWNTAFESVF